MTTLGRLVKHLGALQCVSVAADGKRSLVRLGDFREWSKGVGLSLPLEFPRPSGGSKVSARRGAAAADGAFLRVNDMIPALLPFSPATLWRKVKSGEFPPPEKLSDAANAWRREEIEAWLVAPSQPAQRRHKASNPRPLQLVTDQTTICCASLRRAQLQARGAAAHDRGSTPIGTGSPTRQ